MTDLLTVSEVSKMLRIGKSTVYAYASKGKMKAVYLPSTRESRAEKRNRKAIRFRLADIEAFIHNLDGWS